MGHRAVCAQVHVCHRSEGIAHGGECVQRRVPVEIPAMCLEDEVCGPRSGVVVGEAG